jgi:hypothetical protein
LKVQRSAIFSVWREQRRRIQLAQALQGPQAALAVREYGVPRGLERLP